MSQNVSRIVENSTKKTCGVCHGCMDQLAAAELRQAKMEAQLSRLLENRNNNMYELSSSSCSSSTSICEDAVLDEKLLNSSSSSTAHDDEDETGNKIRGKSAAASVSKATMKQIVEDMFCRSSDRQLAAIQLTRRMLSQDKRPPIDTIIQAGIVPRCVEFLRLEQNPDMQYEAAWILTNITSGNGKQTKAVVDAGAVEPFIDLLQSSENRIAQQAIWALGNIAGDGPTLRDFVISKGAVPPLVDLVKSTNSLALLGYIAWVFSNLCRSNSPPPPQHATKLILPALAALLKLTDMELVADVCWALSYLCTGTVERIEQVVKHGVVPRLVKLLDCGDIKVITPCIRTVGNIVGGSDSQTQLALQAGVLPCLAKFLKSTNSYIVKEAAWAVSNIAAGTHSQLCELVSAGIVPLLVDVLNKGDFRSQREALSAIVNITTGENVNHIIHVTNNKAIPAMCEMLNCRDWRTILATLCGLEKILKIARLIGQDFNVALAIEECGGLELIDECQNHPSVHIYQKAYFILDTYFAE